MQKPTSGPMDARSEDKSAGHVGRVRGSRFLSAEVRSNDRTAPVDLSEGKGNPVNLDQRTVLKIGRSNILDIRLSIPFWEKIARPPANQGFVRHDVERAESRMPAEYKIPYAEHAEPLLTEGHRSFLLIGARNLQQNLLMPAFHADCEPKLLCRFDEPWGTETYSALVRFRDGTLALEQVRFRAGAHPDDADSVEIPSGGSWRQEDVEFAVVGQPLVWDDKLTSISRLAALCYDLRHVWRLRWESHLTCQRDAEIHQELMSALMRTLPIPLGERAGILEEIAGRHNLKLEDAFYHSSLGIDQQGNLILVAMHGSLPDVGRTLLENGVRRALMMDQGGSVGYFLWSSGTEGSACLATGSYFRPRAHAVLAAILQEDVVEPPFRPEIGFDPRPITTKPGKGGAMLDDLEFEIRRRAAGSCSVSYDDPSGHQENELPLPPANAEQELRGTFTHFAAAWIYDHAVLWGTRTVHIDAAPEFVDGVRGAFRERFDKVDAGTGWESGSATDYLSVYNSRPFRIEVGPPPGTGHTRPTPVLPPSPDRALGGGTAVGLDIGSRSVKLVLRRGERTLLHTVFSTRPEHGRATTAHLLGKIAEQTRQACVAGRVQLAEVRAIGVAWPGATHGRTIDATSNLLRELEDLWLPACAGDVGRHDRLDPQKVEKFRNFSALVAGEFGEQIPVFLINDGTADAWYLATRRRLRRAIVIKLGTSIAGGYIDAAGRCEYLTEFGRFCLDLDLGAPPHPFTKITGLARELIPTVALVRLLGAAGLTKINGARIEPKNAGQIAHNLLTSEEDYGVTRVVSDALVRMGEALGHLMRALGRHMPAEHIVLSGGLASDRSRAADILVVAARRVLENSSPQLTFERISSAEDELPEADRFVGAVAGAEYALSLVHP